MKKYSLMLALGLAITSLTGCATVLSGSAQFVQLSSKEKGTDFYINDEFVGTDRTVAILQRQNTYIVRGSKEGCEDTSITLVRELNPVTLLNVFIWPGFIIDGVTGSWYQFQQTTYSTTPKCS